MSQVRTPPNTPSKGPLSGSADYRWAWVGNWIETLIVFAGGIATACLVGWTNVKVHQVWQVSAVAAAALTLGFGAAYLFQQLRQNFKAVALETEFAEVSARINTLSADYDELKSKVNRQRKNSSDS